MGAFNYLQKFTVGAMIIEFCYCSTSCSYFHSRQPTADVMGIYR